MWSWKIAIGPVAIIEIRNSPESRGGFGGPRIAMGRDLAQDKPEGGARATFKHWGMFETRRVYSSWKLPRAGNVISIPTYRRCKIERVFFTLNKPSRDYIVTIVISPSSLGAEEWWEQNINDPIVNGNLLWTFDLSFRRENFKDLNVPFSDYLDPRLKHIEYQKLMSGLINPGRIEKNIFTHEFDYLIHFYPEVESILRS